MYKYRIKYLQVYCCRCQVKCYSVYNIMFVSCAGGPAFARSASDRTSLQAACRGAAIAKLRAQCGVPTYSEADHVLVTITFIPRWGDQFYFILLFIHVG